MILLCSCDTVPLLGRKEMSPEQTLVDLIILCSCDTVPVLGRKEMSPEQTLVEFISTSAAFHGVKSQSLRSLEWDLLKVG